jgi:ABC-2 type transport system ATP-binding protein
MAITVRHLIKRYGEQRAVDDVSFEVGAGQIVGFLGPNGAGKSTTMKVLTGFIPPSSGSAEVCGFDVDRQSLEVRRRIGYLPEHNPLYLDLYVREYLEFVGRLFGLRNRGARIRRMIERTGLGPEQHKRIRQLSKGYRQRVGLAQAMLNDPEVLILDEPTTGLDPNQLAEIRDLIRDLGRKKTVLLSTHVMQEVQALCDRVLIIHRGRLVADAPTAELAARATGGVTLTVRFAEAVPAEALAALPGVTGVHPVAAGDATGWRLDAAEGIEAAVFRLAVDRGWTLLGSERGQRNLEDVFRALTAGGGPSAEGQTPADAPSRDRAPHPEDPAA